jgi:hypothetical protein
MDHILLGCSFNHEVWDSWILEIASPGRHGCAGGRHDSVVAAQQEVHAQDDPLWLQLPI